MHILVVGGNGFIGTHLCKELKKNNYVVSVLDRNIFNSKHNFCDYYIEDDIRNLKPQWFDKVDCVFDYAGISNDPTGNISPELTFEINDIARSDLALLAKNVKIKNYIFASSCSVYGSGSSNDLLSEQSETDPLTPYAISALNAEEKLRKLSSDNFRCTILRHGTVFGFSEKMRFDLVLNSMLRSALEKRKILINGNGLQLRPLLSLETLSTFILSYLKSSFFKDNDFELINLSDENFSVVSIAKVVKSSVEEYLGEKIDLEYVSDNMDYRNYAVSTKKLNSKYQLIGAKLNSNIIVNLCQKFSGVDFADPRFITQAWYKHIFGPELEHLRSF